MARRKPSLKSLVLEIYRLTHDIVRIYFNILSILEEMLDYTELAEDEKEVLKSKLYEYTSNLAVIEEALRVGRNALAGIEQT